MLLLERMMYLYIQSAISINILQQNPACDFKDLILLQSVNLAYHEVQRMKLMHVS